MRTGLIQVLRPMRSAILFTIAVLLARLAYVAWLCPYDLVEDEANYWVWSTQLDWSYYTKGPGIAWAIRGATTVFGTSEASIRSVAVFANGVTTFCVALLAGMVAGEAKRRNDVSSIENREPGTESLEPAVDGRAALFGAACVQLSPIFQGTAVFSTIDGPYTACWAVASVAALWAFLHRSGRGWVIAGAAIGIGFLFKYTILLLVPGLILYALLDRRQLRVTRRWKSRLVTGVGLAAIGMSPVVIWNIQNDGATVSHLLGHLGVQGGDMPVGVPTSVSPTGAPSTRYSPLWTLQFIGTQIGMVGPLLILAGSAAVTRLRYHRNDRVKSAAPTITQSGAAEASCDNQPLRTMAIQSACGTTYLICAAAPIVVFYLIVSFITEPEGNWAMGGYVTLLALSGCGASAGMRSFQAKVHAWRAMPRPRPKLGVTRSKPETVTQVLWHTSVVYGVISGAVMLRLDWMMAASKPIVQAVGPSLGLRPEKLYSGRALNMFDADRMGSSAQDEVVSLRQNTDMDVFVIAQHYGTAAIVSYYMPGRPMVRCSSSRMGGRPTPWDFWAEASLDDPKLVGCAALLLGATKEQWTPYFERVEQVDSETGRLTGEHKRGRLAFRGYGYKGWTAGNESGVSH